MLTPGGEKGLRRSEKVGKSFRRQIVSAKGQECFKKTCSSSEEERLRKDVVDVSVCLVRNLPLTQ